MKELSVGKILEQADRINSGMSEVVKLKQKILKARSLKPVLDIFDAADAILARYQHEVIARLPFNEMMWLQSEDALDTLKKLPREELVKHFDDPLIGRYCRRALL